MKAESEKNIDYLKFRIQKYENDNSTLKNYVKELQKENDNLMKEKEFLEEQINSNLNNMRTSEDKSNYTTLVEETEEKEDNDDKEIKEKKEEKKEEEKSSDKEVSDLEEYQTGNLGELLNDCEELESEEEQKPEDNKDSNTTNENTNIEQKNENHEDDNNNENNKLKDTLITVNEDQDKDKDKDKEKEKEKDVKKTVTFSINTEEKKKLAKKKIKDSIRLRHCGSVKIRVKKGISGSVNSAYNVMFQGKQFQFPSRVVNKKNVDYFKQFFFLLIQAMKINSDKVHLFLGLDPESLYNQCKSEHVPFHKYQKWLEEQLKRKEEINDERKYEDFSTLTGIFCSSLI